MNYGNMLEEFGHTYLQGFVDRDDGIFKAAERIPGFIQLVDAKAGSESPHSHLFHPDQHKAYATNMSLWSSLEPLFAFSYYGCHVEAFARRAERVVKPDFTNYIARWVADDHIPTGVEAYEMQRYLHEHGPTPLAFSFKDAFDAQRVCGYLDLVIGHREICLPDAEIRGGGLRHPRIFLEKVRGSEHEHH